MNDLQKVFNYAGNEVRTIIKEGEPWFVAKDVAEILGYKDTSYAINAHCKGVGVFPIPTTSGVQSMKIIPERDVYRLVMRSKLPNAERFEEWVVGEVLPSIRKHGAYMTENTLEQALSNPDFMIGLLTNLKEEKQKRLAAEERTNELVPKARKYEEFLEADGLTPLSTVGDILGGLSAQKVRKFLQDKGVLWKYKVGGTWKPKQKYGRYFKIVPYVGQYGLGTTQYTSYQLKVTNEGIGFIIELFERQALNKC